MHINIAERFRPYSHLPGTCCILPLTFLPIQIFPARIRILDHEIPLPIVGPVRDFTVQLDLEKARLTVWGHSQQGYFRYHLVPLQEKPFWAMQVEKGNAFLNQEPLGGKIAHKPTCERLSLGLHKAQDWELVKRRSSLFEILPVWFQLGQLVPKPREPYRATNTLLGACREGSIDAFLNLFKAGFEGILSPVKEDLLYQGFSAPVLNQAEDLMHLLSSGSTFIRDLFIEEREEGLTFLKKLPKEFHSGRLCQVKLSCGGVIDFEWSKKLLRRVKLSTKRKKVITLGLQKGLTKFRLRVSAKERGRECNGSQPLEVDSEMTYFLDNFK